MGDSRINLGACLVVIAFLTCYQLFGHTTLSFAVSCEEEEEEVTKRNIVGKSVSDVSQVVSQKVSFKDGESQPVHIGESTIREEVQYASREAQKPETTAWLGKATEEVEPTDRLQAGHSRMAYFTVAHHAMGVYAAKVLEYQLRTRLNSPYHLYTMLEDTPEGATLGQMCERLNLKHLSAKPIEGLVQTNTRLRHLALKLRLFELTDFERIVYLDTDIYVKKNVDFLFQQPGRLSVAGGMEAPGVHNTGVTIAPDAEFAARILRLDLKSYDGDDEGLFHHVVSADEWRELPAHTTVFWGVHQLASWKWSYGSYSIIQMSSAIKPWNFYTVPNMLGDFHLGTALLYMRDMNDALGADGKHFGWHPACVKPLRTVYGEGKLHRPTPSPKLLHKFTVVINACKRLEPVIELVNLYRRLFAVHQVIVVWNPCGLEVPRQFAKLEKVRVVKAVVDNLVHRFTLYPIQTRGVLICDDDIFATPRDIVGAYKAWRNNMDQIVGFYERDVGYNESTKQHTYARPNRKKNEPYSIILTKFMFVRAEYLHMYRCLMPRALLDYVKRMTNCEDISFSMMVSGFTGLPPVRYQPIDPVYDHGSRDTKHSIHARTLKAEDVSSPPAPQAEDVSPPPATPLSARPPASVTSQVHLSKRDHCVHTFKQHYFLYDTNNVRSNQVVRYFISDKERLGRSPRIPADNVTSVVPEDKRVSYGI
mmetsp:Transcript_38246/g.83205  ORF Transcript_38246/g.83205 Transcript_38246/m.83205 type:complete len:704 (-) Transcript_38246:50-2161(-)|eukprot:CAMPEP_0118938830 /NCGR_PEP_ID=MMETSP1169-20130426/27212_1 /TAXON_ID=36882 /ORGANISM="Pyramimonas obovata, Strain CCMP722" /LENGTH=703 /DNA_ID=CAMNT_0006882919 /DNA_START=153 /DNA_END=2264 /DNA_ORIENTATION=+